MKMKDEREEHSDRISRACVFLTRNYGVRPFPELELFLVPFECFHADGTTYMLKGRYTRSTDTIEILEGKDALLALMHEFHDGLDARPDTIPKNPVAALRLDPEGEAEVRKRALADLESSRFRRSNNLLEIARRREEHAASIRKKWRASCSKRQ